jgi:hypothetical protein
MEWVLQGLEDWFLSMGFTMVVEDPVYILEKVVFCQTQPVCDGFEWTMVRDVRTAMAKDTVSVKPLSSPSAVSKWVEAISDCGLSLTGGIPVWHSFYSYLKRVGHIRSKTRQNSRRRKNNIYYDNLMQTGFFYMAKGMKRENLNVTPAARLSFYLAFDVQPDLQVAIENEFQRKHIVATLSNDPVASPSWLHF